MKARPKGRTRTVGTSKGGLLLHRGQARHLRAALEQMDLLLTSQQTQAGLARLVDLLRHLRRLKPCVA